jgi:hypothetical protein
MPSGGTTVRSDIHKLNKSMQNKKELHKEEILISTQLLLLYYIQN